MAIFWRREKRNQKFDEFLARIIQCHQRGSCAPGGLTFGQSLPEHLPNHRHKQAISTHTCSNQGVVDITFSSKGVHDITEPCASHRPLWMPIR